MMLFDWVKSCCYVKEIQKKEINLNDLDNNNLLPNNNKYLQIQNQSFKERKSTTNSSLINTKNYVEQNNYEIFSNNNYISPLSIKKKLTPPNEVKSVKTHQLKVKHAHFPKINSDKIESEFEKDKKIKNIRNKLMKDLF